MPRGRTFARFVPFFEVGDDADAVYHERVGAQVGHFIRDVNVEAVQHRNDSHQGGDRQNYPEQGQECPQLVRPERVQSNPDRLAQGGERLPGFGTG